MRTEELERIILKLVKGDEFHGYEVHKKLASENVKVELSRLYRVLNAMMKEGLLDGRFEKSQLGPRKRVYRLGERGRGELGEILSEAIETVHSFYEDYLRDLPPDGNVFDRICRMITDEAGGQGNIAYVTSNYSTMHRRMIRTLHDKVPQGRIYFVKPASVAVDLKLDNL